VILSFSENYFFGVLKQSRNFGMIIQIQFSKDLRISQAFCRQ